MSFDSFSHRSHTKFKRLNFADKAKFKPLYSGANLSYGIDTQTENRRAPNVSQAFNLSGVSIDREVSAPIIAARLSTS